MFEKEAQYYAFDEVNHRHEWYIKHPEYSIDWDYEDIKKHWGKGAEFGYNKTNEWYYPSKGEYPKEHQLVLGIFQPNEYYTPTELVYYEKELNCWSNQMGDSEYHNIYAWKEIVLPKE